MSQQLGGQPILILREGSSRTRGQEAQQGNFAAAQAVANAVRTTLGPNGMDKMLVDSMGDVVITNDGATILKEMDIEHPAAKMLVEVAKTQDDETGDGTTTAVIIAGELLKSAEGLLNKKIHPTIIAEGYRHAAEKAQEILRGLAIEVKPGDEKILRSIAETALIGKITGPAKDTFCSFIVRAVSLVADPDGTADISHISVEKKVGGSIENSELVEGIVIDKERTHAGMPKLVKNAKILLLNASVEYRKTEVNAKINLSTPEQVQAFIDEEASMIRTMADHIIKSGANVVFCQKGIDDAAQHFLAKAGILAIRRVKKSDMENLARATGATIVNSIDAITPADLGAAGLVEEKKLAGEEMIAVSRCKNPKAVTILVHGGTEHVVNELERSVHDALRVVSDVIEDRKLVAGGGAPEAELALQLQRYATLQGGREQLAIEAFASALEIIPRTLAVNSGLDAIDMVVALRVAHERGKKTWGLDLAKGAPADMLKAWVVEPLRVKQQAVTSAAEAAIMLLRIDDIIAASQAAGPGGLPGGPGGMGGMPPGMGEY